MWSIERDFSEWKVYAQSNVIGYMAYCAPELLTRCDIEFDFTDELCNFTYSLCSEDGNRSYEDSKKLAGDYRAKLSEEQMTTFWKIAKDCCEKSCAILKNHVGVSHARIVRIDDERRVVYMQMY